jgi:hypothetical protein
MVNILSFPWDGNSFDTSNKILRVLDVASGDSKLDRVVTTPIATNDNNLRVGHIYANKRRRFFDTPKNPSASTTTMDNINYFHNKTATIGTSGAYDYKDSGITMASKVFYISDSANYNQKNITFNVSISSVGSSTNIKIIELNTTSPLLGKSFILRAFMCNIGQSGLLERTYP